MVYFSGSTQKNLSYPGLEPQLGNPYSEIQTPVCDFRNPLVVHQFESDNTDVPYSRTQNKFDISSRGENPPRKFELICESYVNEIRLDTLRQLCATVGQSKPDRPGALFSAHHARMLSKSSSAFHSNCFRQFSFPSLLQNMKQRGVWTRDGEGVQKGLGSPFLILLRVHAHVHVRVVIVHQRK